MTAGDLVTAPWHVEWRGLLLGWPLTSTTLSGLTGWLDLPGMRTATADRPGRHGGYPGQQRAGSRLIEASFIVAREDAAALPALRDALAPTEDPVEEPLVIWAGTDAPQLVYARVERAAVPTDYEFSLGFERATVQWLSSGARRLSLAEHVEETGLIAGALSGGLEWPLEWPIEWGTGTQVGGVLTVRNEGNVAAWPIFEVEGLVAGPIIRQQSTGETLRFDPSWTVDAGQVVEIDTDFRAVTLSGVRRDDRLWDRGWFPLLPGVDTSIAFTAAGAWTSSARLRCRWRDSSM